MCEDVWVNRVSHRQPLHLPTSRPVLCLIASLSIKMQSAVTSLNPLLKQANTLDEPPHRHTYTRSFTTHRFYRTFLTLDKMWLCLLEVGVMWVVLNRYKHWRSDRGFKCVVKRLKAPIESFWANIHQSFFYFLVCLL